MVDAVVVGVPDDRLGEAVAAVVEVDDGASVNVEALREGVRQHLAGFKVPRHVVLRPVGRAVNGKADYRSLRDEAIKATGA